VHFFKKKNLCFFLLICLYICTCVCFSVCICLWVGVSLHMMSPFSLGIAPPHSLTLFLFQINKNKHQQQPQQPPTNQPQHTHNLLCCTAAVENCRFGHCHHTFFFPLHSFIHVFVYVLLLLLFSYA